MSILVNDSHIYYESFKYSIIINSYIHTEDLYDVVLYKKQKSKRKEKYVKLFLSNDFFPLLDEFHQLKIDKIQVLTI